jgi:hypothetical protein
LPVHLQRFDRTVASAKRADGGVEGDMKDDDLLIEFVEAFEILDDMIAVKPFPHGLQVINDVGDKQRLARWKPVRVVTDPNELFTLYKLLPSPFPPLYERLALSYRWLEVHLGNIVCLLQNSGSDSLMPLLKEITRDDTFVRILLPLGLIPFGKAAGDCYDPVCFDTRRPTADGDYPIIRLEHEAILCNERIGDSWQVAESFRTLVETVIMRASEIAKR